MESPPVEQRLSAPELHTRAVILREFQATPHRSFDRSQAAMNSEAPPLDAARSNHTSRWAAQEDAYETEPSINQIALASSR